MNFCLSILFLLASNCLVMEFIPNMNLRWALYTVHFKVVLYWDRVFGFPSIILYLVWKCQEYKTSLNVQFKNCDHIIRVIFRWIETYKGALSYRCSHYFICYASHCTMLMSGFHPPKSSKKDKTMLGYSITWPRVIEFPRSLVNVVVYWNLSMHYWLKTCNYFNILTTGWQLEQHEKH